ncbi:hypothetical protein EGW08_016865, partial [Elysia chlorotica]
MSRQTKMLKALLLSATLLLAVVLIVRTVHLSRRPAQASECKPTDSDFIPLSEERLQRFQNALRFESVSHDSGDSNYEEMFKFGEFIIASFPHIHRLSPLVSWERVNNLSLLYEIRGSEPGLKPYLLMAHIDVVPVSNLDQWDAPPFSGQVKDGFIYGRGTIDDKNNLMGILEATEFMLASNIQPKRSLYISFGHDEETRGNDGAAQVAERLKEKGVTEFEFVVDEGMTVLEDIVDGVAGPVARLEENPHPGMLGSGVETDMFENLVPTVSVAVTLCLVQQTVSMAAGLKREFLSKSPLTNSMIRTVTAVTIFNSGIKLNIVPPKAEATVNHRMHTSQTVQEVLDYDRAVIADPRVKMELVYSMEPHPVSGYGQSDFGYQVSRAVEQWGRAWG